MTIISKQNMKSTGGEIRKFKQLLKNTKVSKDLSKLNDKYKEKTNTELQKDNINSKYFKDVTSSKPCGTEKEEYTEK